ncbi:hypothetical protein G4L39_05395 [Limisphaera ngatamarikiensis]|uniref:Uncharacterized protein n=1 Tax=Limisphaera ngatamarikiensis TaxID=1324935 RepID=A0A6M1S0D4_9BACT|nr:hypothetical protein [Limisphaera ngatamarikiensis]NGO38830.1 hypothetical protein [Limisphaera ngatamarikiensis]
MAVEGLADGARFGDTVCKAVGWQWPELRLQVGKCRVGPVSGVAVVGLWSWISPALFWGRPLA